MITDESCSKLPSKRAISIFSAASNSHTVAQCFSNFNRPQKSPAELVKTHFLGTNPTWGLRFCISNQLPSHADMAKEHNLSSPAVEALFSD